MMGHASVGSGCHFWGRPTGCYHAGSGLCDRVELCRSIGSPSGEFRRLMFEAYVLEDKYAVRADGAAREVPSLLFIQFGRQRGAIGAQVKGPNNSFFYFKRRGLCFRAFWLSSKGAIFYHPCLRPGPSTRMKPGVRFVCCTCPCQSPLALWLQQCL